MKTIEELIEERVSLEQRLQDRGAELSGEVWDECESKYQKLQQNLITLFRSTEREPERIAAMLEMIRVLENELVYLHNFSVDPSHDRRALASRVRQFLEELDRSESGVLTSLESTYYRGIIALYAGDLQSARRELQAACESEESDEANDIKYKSFVILGNLSHEDADYEAAEQLHERSMRYARHDNITAQALALKALNSYALRNRDEALTLFRRALAGFHEDQPFYNAYFHRNALLFCGLIEMERENYEEAAAAYRDVLGRVTPGSFDSFDARVQLGRIEFARRNYHDAAEHFRQAVAQQAHENEYFLDACFWLARAHLRAEEPAEAKPWLQRVVHSEVPYARRPQAEELLARVS